MRRTNPDFLPTREVVKRTGLSRTHVWYLVREGRFPEPVELTERARGWREDEVEAWKADRLKAHAERLAKREENHAAA